MNIHKDLDYWGAFENGKRTLAKQGNVTRKIRKKDAGSKRDRRRAEANVRFRFGFSITAVVVTLLTSGMMAKKVLVKEVFF